MFKSKQIAFYSIVVVSLGMISYFYFLPKSITNETLNQQKPQVAQMSQLDDKMVVKESLKEDKSAESNIPPTSTPNSRPTPNSKPTPSPTAPPTQKSQVKPETANESKTVTSQSATNNQTATPQATPVEKVKTFTAATLAKYNGQNGNPAYIAVNGKVYDVSNTQGWSNGSHQGYPSGKDYSKEIKNSPHGTSVLAGLAIIGTYSDK